MNDKRIVEFSTQLSGDCECECFLVDRETSLRLDPMPEEYTAEAVEEDLEYRKHGDSGLYRMYMSTVLACIGVDKYNGEGEGIQHNLCFSADVPAYKQEDLHKIFITVLLEFEYDDGAWVASVPGLPSVVDSGSTMDEAVTYIIEAFEGSARHYAETVGSIPWQGYELSTEPSELYRLVQCSVTVPKGITCPSSLKPSL